MYPRVAIVVPRFGATAVARNRLKRRLRELVRRELLPVLPRRDVVVRATPQAYRAPFETLLGGMREAASRASQLR
jgi:ribonuclease P protein component